MVEYNLACGGLTARKPYTDVRMRNAKTLLGVGEGTGIHSSNFEGEALPSAVTQQRPYPWFGSFRERFLRSVLATIMVWLSSMFLPNLIRSSVMIVNGKSFGEASSLQKSDEFSNHQAPACTFLRSEYLVAHRGLCSPGLMVLRFVAYAAMA